MKLDHTAAGVYAIAATPFHPDGRLDTESVDRLTDFYIGCGVTGLTILGIMGEAPKLEPEESLAITSGEERTKTFQEANRLIAEELVPDVPMFHMVSYMRVGPRVQYTPNSLSGNQLELAHIKID